MTIKGRVLEDINIEEPNLLEVDRKRIEGTLKTAWCEILEMDPAVSLDITTLEIKEIKSEQDQWLFGAPKLLRAPRVFRNKFDFKSGAAAEKESIEMSLCSDEQQTATTNVLVKL